MVQVGYQIFAAATRATCPHVSAIELQLREHSIRRRNAFTLTEVVRFRDSSLGSCRPHADVGTLVCSRRAVERGSVVIISSPGRQARKAQVEVFESRRGAGPRDLFPYVTDGKASRVRFFKRRSAPAAR